MRGNDEQWVNGPISQRQITLKLMEPRGLNVAE